MEFDEKTYDKIDRYLNNEMTDSELKDFEIEKNANKKLADEIEIHAELIEYLADSPENKLRQNLETLSSQYGEKSKTPVPIHRRNRFRMLLQIAAAVLIAGMLWWLFHQSEDVSKDENPIVKTPQNSSPSNNQNDNEFTPQEETKSQIADQENSPQIKEELEKPQQLPKKEASPAENKPQFIAADFEPNPSLDFLIGNNLRSTDINFLIDRKIGNTTLSSLKDIVEFRISGKVNSNDDLKNGNFKVHLFSNKINDYEDFNSIFSSDLKLQKGGENYLFDFQKNIQLKPGLYYFLIEDDQEKIHFVDKFEVRI